MERAFSKLPLFVAYYRRAYPRFVKLKQDLAAGRLGTIQSVSYVFARRPGPPRVCDWRLDAERSGGGKFVDIGSHALDLIDFLLGPLERVRASARGPAGQVETKVEMHFRIGKIDGTATWNFEASEAEDLLVVTGSAGSVRAPSAMNGRELVWADGVETYDPPDPVQLPLVTKVVDAILDGSECPSTATSSTRTSRAIDAAGGFAQVAQRLPDAIKPALERATNVSQHGSNKLAKCAGKLLAQLSEKAAGQIEGGAGAGAAAAPGGSLVYTAGRRPQGCKFWFSRQAASTK